MKAAASTEPGPPSQRAGSEATRLPASVDRAAVGLAWVMLAGLLGAVGLRSPALLAGVGCLGLLGVGIELSRHDRPRTWWPTAVTALRVGLVTALAASSALLPNLAIGAVVALVLALDGLDGALARRTDSVSVLGAHLDMEADGLLCAVTCFLLWLEAGIAAWVLTAGFLRYGYVLLVRALPSNGAAPRSRFASRAFGFAMLGLIAGFLELGPWTIAGPFLATVLLCWSFGRSFYWSFAANKPATS